MRFFDLVDKYKNRTEYLRGEIDRSYLSSAEKKRVKLLWDYLVSVELEVKDKDVWIMMEKYEDHVEVFGRKEYSGEFEDLSFMPWPEWMGLSLSEELLRNAKEEDILIYSLQQMSVWGVDLTSWERSMDYIATYDWINVMDKKTEG